MLIEIGVDYYQETPLEYQLGMFVKREKYQMTTINPQTGEEIEVIRTRNKLFHLKFTEFDPVVLELLLAKYYYKIQ